MSKLKGKLILSIFYLSVEVRRLPFSTTKSGDFAELITSITLQRTRAKLSSNTKKQFSIYSSNLSFVFSVSPICNNNQYRNQIYTETIRFIKSIWFQTDIKNITSWFEVNSFQFVVSYVNAYQSLIPVRYV